MYLSVDLLSDPSVGNASGLNDGAAALILMTEDKANELGLSLIAKNQGCQRRGMPSVSYGAFTCSGREKADQ